MFNQSPFYNMFNQSYMMQMAQRQYNMQQVANVQISVHKLKDFLESTEKISPEYTGLAIGEFLNTINTHYNNQRFQ